MKIDSVEVSTEAVWVTYDEDFRLLLRRWNNPAFKKEVKKLQRPLLKGLRRGSSQAETAMESVQQRAASKHVLVGWSGLEDSEGNEIPYSPEKALEYFRSDNVPLYDFVVEEAGDLANFRSQDIEDITGN